MNLGAAFLMPKTKLSREALKSVAIPIGRPRQDGRAATKAGAWLFGAMAAEVAELSVASGLDSLAVACDVVREIAEGDVNSQSR